MAAPTSLGLPGPWADDYWERTNHYTSKIGGAADWPDEALLAASSELFRCQICGEDLRLVAQVYAPLSSPQLHVEERTIYVLACPKPQCCGDHSSWRAVRAQGLGDGAEIKTSGGSKGNNYAVNEASSSSGAWLQGDFKDEDEEDIDLEDLGRALEEAAYLASIPKRRGVTYSDHKPGGDPGTSKQTAEEGTRQPVFPCFYIVYEDEHMQSLLKAGPTSSAGGSQPAISVEEQDAPVDQEEGRWEGETYEHGTAPGADRTYLKFKKRLDAYPEQCLRYSFGGNPLLATLSPMELKTCKNCGSPLVYEFQLMPPLLYFLHEAAAAPVGSSSICCLPDGWTWLTVLVYTCSKSCRPLPGAEAAPQGANWGVVEEVIIIQEDPSASLFPSV